MNSKLNPNENNKSMEVQSTKKQNLNKVDPKNANKNMKTIKDNAKIGINSYLLLIRIEK